MKILIDKLKDNNQNWEFYPTTAEIINKINSLYNKGSILDIGCGDGRTLMKLQGFDKKFGIEKSQILISKCDPSIIIIGTDFEKQTLIDKNVDNIFCNPPYSDFKNWTKKILKESCAKKVYLVIPTRWKNDEEIKDIIKKRGWFESLHGSYDFLEADRKARAFVDLVSFSQPSYAKTKDAFDFFFEETFKFRTYEQKEEEQKKESIKNEIVKGDLVKSLCALHDSELQNIFDNYKKIETLDPLLMKELGIKINDIKESLKLRISGLKKLYWQELFSKFNGVLTRLSYKYRTELREKFQDKVDFNEENILAIMIWIVNNTNSYLDKQLIDLFYEFVDEKNIKNYKSNQKTWVAENFRWGKNKEVSKVYLDYRIIIEKWGSDYLDNGKFKYCYHSTNYDNNAVKCLLQDIVAVAYNMGFIVEKIPLDGWEYGKSRNINYSDGIFMEVKIFKKGTLHIRFCQEFIKKLNVNVSRLLGWIKDKSGASEMNMSEKEFESNCINQKITKQLLLA